MAAWTRWAAGVVGAAGAGAGLALWRRRSQAPRAVPAPGPAEAPPQAVPPAPAEPPAEPPAEDPQAALDAARERLRRRADELRARIEGGGEPT
jgi:hypothetical protein